MANAFGSAPGLIVATGVGTAAALALQPAVELPRQEAWAKNPNRVFDLNTLARLVATGGIGIVAADDEAKRDGYGPDKLNQAIYLAQRVPPFAQALELWRRDLIHDDLYGYVLVKEGWDTRYIAALENLKLSEPLDPVQLANAIHRGLLADPGLLTLQLDLGPGKVKSYTVSPIDAVTEAGARGFSEERLRVLVGLQGLPMGSHEAAQAFFRQVIERTDFNRAIAEGNTRNEWADAILEQSRAIPTPTNYVEGHLKSWLTPQEMNDGAARHGMVPEDTDLLFKIAGRPATPRQLWLGWARKVPAPDYPGEPANGRLMGFRDHELAIARSNIRPEYAPALWDIRFNYPSLFQLGRLVQAGAIDSEQAALWASYNLEAPDVIDALKVYWDSLGGAKKDPWVAKAEGQLWTATHKAYVGGAISEQEATTAITAVGVAAGSEPAVLHLWSIEKAIAASSTPGSVVFP